MHFSEIIGTTGLFCDGDWIETKDQDPNGKVRLIQLADIGAGVFRDKSSKFVTEEKAKELGCTYLEKGDILISRLGAILGRSCIFPLSGRFITAVDVAILRIKDPQISPEYICYMLNSAPFRVAAKPYESGTTRKRISRKNLDKIDFVLPSYKEQLTVVSHLDAVFSQLKESIETLKKTQAQLEVYRQAVLREAFEGSYTKDCGETKTIKTIADFAEVETGATPLKSNSAYYGGSIPWVSSGKINDDFITTPTDMITELALRETNCKVFPVHTLLVAMYGEGKTRGKCAELLIPAATNQALAAIILPHDSLVDRSYLKWYLTYNYQIIRRKAVGGVQPNLSLGIIKNFEIPIYSISTQQKIVREIESRISVYDSIWETIDTVFQQAEAMHQSILKQAFEGRL